MTTTDATACVYDGSPAVTVRTGATGNRFGLCAVCAPSHEQSLVASEAIAEMELFRAEMRRLGQASPAVEKFVDEVCALISVCGDPKAAIDTVFRVLAVAPPAAAALGVTA
ncbi:hypothetical protein ACF1AY_04755 [Streptomyces sp. NPDC014776]|uniref:hypothetical protein n=1 Tax=Streptomyces sp. NPDC014776 TaxID=3364909 RepID=UPI0036FFFB37